MFPVVEIHDDRRGLCEPKFAKRLSSECGASPALTLKHNRALKIGLLRRSDMVPDLGIDDAAWNVDRPWDMPGCIFLRFTDIDEQGSSRVVDDLSIVLHADGSDRFLGRFNFLLRRRRGSERSQKKKWIERRR